MQGECYEAIEFVFIQAATLFMLSWKGTEWRSPRKIPKRILATHSQPSMGEIQDGCAAAPSGVLTDFSPLGLPQGLA